MGKVNDFFCYDKLFLYKTLIFAKKNVLLHAYMAKLRESNYEMLRIISILMIVMMHAMAPLFKTQNQVNQELLIGVNSVANTGVSLFILISGYFGLRYKLKRLLSIVGIVVFYALLSFVVDKYVFNIDIKIKNYLPYMFPLMCKKYWFITCYVIVYCLSPWLNRIPECLSRKDFRKLLVLLILIFWVVPTMMVFHEILNDNGKGVVNMTVLYLIGRYIRLHGFSLRITTRPWLVAFVCFLLIFVLNNVLLYYFKPDYMRFCRDCSVLILLQSLCIFYLFSKVHFQSKIVNYLAGYAFPLYLVNRIILDIAYKFYPVDINSIGVWGDIFLNIGLTIIGCLIIENVRRYTFGFIPLKR